MYNFYQSKRNKFGNTKVKYGNETFDSKKELNRWLELQLLERAGAITNLQRQVEFELIPNQYNKKKKVLKSGKVKQEQKLVERKCCYVADFVYKDDKGNLIVEDTKSNATKTEFYVLKRKLMLYRYGIQIQEI